MLRFELKYNQECRQYITLTNTSGDYIIYKVKTTLPETYYVSPNVDCLKNGEHVKIGVTLVNDECNKFIEKNRLGKPVSVDKHRFKVECAPITAADYDGLKANELSSKERSEKYNEFLKTVSTDRYALKFRVDFTYPPAADLDSPETDVIREPASVSGKSSVNPTATDIGFNDFNGPGYDPNSIDAIITELQALRTKYDKVLELTVNLTAEKDNMIARLNAKQNERKEMTKLKEKERKGAKALANASKKRGMFSYSFLIIAAIIAYVVGYYLEHVKIFSKPNPRSEL